MSIANVTNFAIQYSAGAVASMTYTLTGVTAGNVLTLAITSLTAGAHPYTVSDGVNAWVLGASQTVSTESGDYWYCNVSKGGTLTVTITPSASAAMTAIAHEYSCSAGDILTFFGSGHNTASSVATFTTASVTVPSPGTFLLWAAASVITSGPIAATAPMVQRTASANTNSSGWVTGADRFIVNTSQGATADFTTAGSTNWTGCALVFKEITAALPGRIMVARERYADRYRKYAN